MAVTIEIMKKEDASEVARLHISGIKTGFISSLGLKFVTALYEVISPRERSFCVVAKEDGKILGFAAFNSDVNRLLRTVIAQNGIRFIWLLGRKLISAALIKKIVNTILYPIRTRNLDLPPAELLSTVVTEEARGRGIATMLIQAGLKECVIRGLTKIKLLVISQNEPANKLYLKNGFKFVRQIKNHGRLSNIYVISLDNVISVTTYKANTRVSEILHKYGIYIIDVDGVKWREYAGYMIPAYMPHSCPPIIQEMAEKVVRISGRPFARWSTDFGRQKPKDWWYILKKKQWDIEQIADKKKRWMIRQGRKNFSVRLLTYDEVLEKCPAVAITSVNRYEEKICETKELLQLRLAAAEKLPSVLEYIGCFSGNKLVSFAENEIQDNAVFIVYIRQDPLFLKDYSSYALIDGILDYYLNQKKFYYVLDGARCIHHRTNFQELLIKIFGFQKEYALLNVVYSKRLAFGIKLAWPFRKIFWAIWEKWSNPFFDNVSAVLRLEAIRRNCQ